MPEASAYEVEMIIEKLKRNRSSDVDTIPAKFNKFFFPMPPHVLYGLRSPPSWAWQECNRLLRLGRP